MKNNVTTSIKKFESKDSLDAHKRTATECNFVAANNIILGKDKLIHEHDFVTTTINKGDCLIRCITCDAYFCNLCGKLLDDTEDS